MKIPISKKEISRLFMSIDINSDNKITVAEFDIFVNTRHNQIKKVFEKIDRDSNGAITSEELRFSVQSLGSYTNTIIIILLLPSPISSPSSL